MTTSNVRVTTEYGAPGFKYPGFRYLGDSPHCCPCTDGIDFTMIGMTVGFGLAGVHNMNSRLVGEAPACCECPEGETVTPQMCDATSYPYAGPVANRWYDVDPLANPAKNLAIGLTHISADAYRAIVLSSDGPGLSVDGFDVTINSPSLSSATRVPLSNIMAPGVPVSFFGGSTVTLPDCRVFVFGKFLFDGDVEDSCHIYDPVTNSWLAIDQQTSIIDYNGNSYCFLLPGNRVLIVGEELRSAIYDVGSNTWEPLGVDSGYFPGPVDYNPGFYTACQLPDGRIVMSGGCLVDDDIPTTRSYAFDPVTHIWTRLADMHYARVSHTLNIMTDGKVLAVGGSSIGSGLFDAGQVYCEIYDPDTNTWADTYDLNFARVGHACIVLPNGRPFVIGGRNTDVTDSPGTCETYRTSLESWATGGSIAIPRSDFAAILIPSTVQWTILITGGTDANNFSIAESQLRSFFLLLG